MMVLVTFVTSTWDFSRFNRFFFSVRISRHFQQLFLLDFWIKRTRLICLFHFEDHRKTLNIYGCTVDNSQYVRIHLHGRCVSAFWFVWCFMDKQHPSFSLKCIFRVHEDARNHSQEVFMKCLEVNHT